MSRVAVVTGANRGLGFAISEALAGQGLHVVMTGRDERSAIDAAGKLAASGLPVSAHQLDVTDPASVTRAMQDVAFEHGRLDVLVNNAAVAVDRGRQAQFADMELVLASLNTNLVGAWRCCSAAIPHMRQGGYGRIVNLTSHMSLLSTMASSSPAYRVSKTGLNALTRVLADELRPDNILVNGASPGLVATRLAYGKAQLTPAQVVDTFIWLATLPDDGPTGQLFHERQPLQW